MLTTTEWRLVRDYVQTALNRFTSVGPFPSWRPGTMNGASGLPATAGVDCFVKLDGDTAPIPAQNISGISMTDGQRVMTVFAPPHVCFIIGPITHWPVEQGLIGEGEYAANAGKTTVSWAWTGLTCAFTAPASGRVRVVAEANTATLQTSMYWRLYDSLASAYVANSYRVCHGYSTAMRVHMEWIIGGLTPGNAHSYDLYFNGNVATNQNIWGDDGSGGDGSYGPQRMEVWAMPPASD